jgi:hypothetical protein
MKESEKLDNAVIELEKQAIQLKDFNKVYTAMASLRESIESGAKDLSLGTAELSTLKKEIQSTLESFSTKVDEIYSDQKRFYKELDDSITSRLDRQKSELQLEIRNEISQLQKVIDNSLESRLRSLDDQHKKRYKVLLIILILTLMATSIIAVQTIIPFF